MSDTLFFSGILLKVPFSFCAVGHVAAAAGRPRGGADCACPPGEVVPPLPKDAAGATLPAHGVAGACVCGDCWGPEAESAHEQIAAGRAPAV
jgi:hypothetical protein